MDNIIFSLCFVIAVGNGWDLNHLGIDENYYVSSIAIYRARAFLALPRSLCHNNISAPTVVEVPWTGSYQQQTPNPFRLKILDYQKWKDCKNIQDAVSLDVERRKPKLWILDKGNTFCSPKILSYNVIFNIISEISELKNVNRENLNIITIDPKYTDFGSRMYIGNAGDNTILMFSSDNLKWRKLKVQVISYPAVPVHTDFLAISKTDPVLYVTGRNSLELFSINLDDIRNFGESPSYKIQKATNDFFMTVNATLIGKKLGMSTGLETDYKSGLSYYMVRDYVVVRWLIGFPMEAEYHRVLTQSYEEMPYVSELFTDSQNGLWALVNPSSIDNCREMNNTIKGNIPKLDRRIVKILKYNKFLGDIY